MTSLELKELLESHGVGRRKLHDALFASANERPPRLGIYDVDDETLCHDVIRTTCHIPGCAFTTDVLLEFENHYNTSHRYTCSECKKVLPSPHLLDLHIQETHDSFFAVMAVKKASYCCYIEECKEKFFNASDRLEHCVKTHKLPRDFRFDQKPRLPKTKNGHVKKKLANSMEVDSTGPQQKGFTFTNSKQKAFTKYTGRKFTNYSDKTEVNTDVDMNSIVKDLKESLPSNSKCDS